MFEEPQSQLANGVAHKLPPQGNTNPQLRSALPSTSFLVRDQPSQAELVREIRDLPPGLYAAQPGIGWIPFSRSVLALARSAREGSVQPVVRSPSAEGVVPFPHVNARDLELAGEVALFREIMSDWGLSDQQASAVLGYKEPTFATDLFKGLTSIRQRDAEERLQLVITIAIDLEALYRDYDVIKRWLRKPHELLKGEIPLKIATEGTSLDLFKLSEYVEYLSGR